MSLRCNKLRVLGTEDDIRSLTGFMLKSPLTMPVIADKVPEHSRGDVLAA